jgi:Zn-finger nucleic acid-binding protein
MKCPKCDNTKKLKAKNIKYDYSAKCGIPQCFITAKEYTCPKCSNVVTDLGDVKEINEAIAEVLMRAVELTRPIIKYVRIHFFDESTFQFAKRIKMNPSVYDEIENFKRPMNEVVSLKVKEQLELYFMKQKLGPITMVVGNKKTKLDYD